MNQYQKVYMNQIHSSSLLGQLAQMWRSQMLCDALIKTGNVTTKVKMFMGTSSLKCLWHTPAEN